MYNLVILLRSVPPAGAHPARPFLRGGARFVVAFVWRLLLEIGAYLLCVRCVTNVVIKLLSEVSFFKIL